MIDKNHLLTFLYVFVCFIMKFKLCQGTLPGWCNIFIDTALFIELNTH